MRGPRARALRGEMPQPSSSMEAFECMVLARMGFDGEESHEAKLGAIFHNTVSQVSLSSRGVSVRGEIYQLLLFHLHVMMTER